MITKHGIKVIAKQGLLSFEFGDSFNFELNELLTKNWCLHVLKVHYDCNKSLKLRNFNLGEPIKFYITRGNKIIRTLKQVRVPKEVKNTHDNWSSVQIDGNYYKIVPFHSDSHKNTHSLLTEEFNEKKFLEAVEFFKLLENKNYSRSISSGFEMNRRKH